MKPRASSVGLVSSVLSLAMLATACGGSSTQDLFAPQTTSEFATEPPTGSKTPGSSGSGSDASAGSSGGSSSSGSSSGGSSGSSGASGSSGTSGTTPWKSPGVLCGADPGGADVYCPPTSSCCARRQDGDMTFTCGGGIAWCAGGTPVRCDDRTDCPSNQVCCGSFEEHSGYSTVQCQPNCNGSPIPSVTTVRFCDPHAPADECADIAKVCRPSGSLDGFHVCK